PVGAVLIGRVAVLKRLSGDYAVKADARHAVHLEGWQDAVPVNGSILIQFIFNPDEHLLAFLHPNQRPRNAAIDADGFSCFAIDIFGHAADGKVNNVIRSLRGEYISFLLAKPRQGVARQNPTGTGKSRQGAG